MLQTQLQGVGGRGKKMIQDPDVESRRVVAKGEKGRGRALVGVWG